jgi:uncharacterized protein
MCTRNNSEKENPDGSIIDFHAHIFPEKVAKKATEAIGRYYDIKMTGNGTASGLILEGKKIGVKKYIVHSTATIPAQVEVINDFIGQICVQYPSFVGFGTLHPGFKNHDAEMDRIISAGMKGIKLHPEFQHYSIDDDLMMAVYKAVAGRLPILMHVGDEKKDSSSPARLRRILDRFPDLVVIAAHLGGYRVWQESRNLLVGTKVFFDTSSTLAFLKPDEACDIIRSHGADRVLFGTDYPMWTHQDELSRFMQLPLSDDEREKILWKNAAKLLKI